MKRYLLKVNLAMEVGRVKMPEGVVVIITTPGR